MAPPKRRRRRNRKNNDDSPAPPQPPSPIITRRSTRHTPNPAPPVPPSTTAPAATSTAAESTSISTSEHPTSKSKRGRPPASATATESMATTVAAPMAPKTGASASSSSVPIRHVQTTLKWPNGGPRADATNAKASKVAKGNKATNGSHMATKENVKPTQDAAPSILSAAQRTAKSSTATATAESTKHQPSKSATRKQTSSSSTSKEPSKTLGKSTTPTVERNIDKVVLGNICFRTWYPSYYGKDVLGETASAGRPDASTAAGPSKSHARRDRDTSPVLDRLYVCPCCFKYSKELVTWWEHVRVCESKGFIPGRKIYAHPKMTRTVLVPAETNGKAPKRRRGDAGPVSVPQTVQDEGEWSVWEVDGEKDVLFCQNLSLFAKLFLDNKSVFFDVTGFNYFLLVHSKPVPPTGRSNGPAIMKHHICGFFSKEKLSWDNNNLACILVFPPWQRKGLGSLLMGVSYEIARHEGILGGPEKPISELGRKGYRRFWSGEIARWILSLDTSGGSAPSASPSDKKRKGVDDESGEREGEEVIIDVADCSKATWITPEDCLGVLRDMGVVEDAGIGPGKPPAPVPSPDNAAAAEEEEEEGDDVDGQAEEKDGEASKDKETTTKEDGDVQPEPKMVPRVRITRDAVRAWVVAQRINLTRPCDPSGFVPHYLEELKVRRESVDAEEVAV